MSHVRTLGEIADSGDRWSHIHWSCVRAPKAETNHDHLRSGAIRRAQLLRNLVMTGGGGEIQYRRTVLANRLRLAWDLGAG